MNGQKRILAINDISCFGKCSLTAAVPILSAAGIEACVLPTAVLSSHTGFRGYTFRDLTDDMLPTVNHWRSLGLTFDGIYTGYLGSKKQISYIEKIIDMFETDYVLVDPVMGDNGKLYDGFDGEYAEEMKRLTTKADIIVPNVTEAAFLAGVPYEDGIHSKEYIQAVIEKLRLVCGGKIVLTGINLGKQTVGTAVCDGTCFCILENEKLDVCYSGTGDVFASTLAAAVMLGKNIKNAAEISIGYVIACISATREASGNRSYGVNFELCTKKLLHALGLID